MHSSGTYQCPPFIFADSENSVNLVVACDGFHWVMRNRPYFSQWILLIQRYFSNTSWFVLLCNKSNIADREGQWIPQFQGHASLAQPDPISLHGAYRLKIISACSKQRTVMDTSLWDIIEAHVTITTLWCGMRGFISQSILLFAKKM